MKLLNRTKLALSYLLKRPQVWGGPVEISLEITNRCNLACLMCPRATLKRPVGDMELPLFKKIVVEVKSTLELIYLHLAGEPLLHPRLLEMIAFCKKNKIPVGLSTNATLLDERYSRELVKSRLDYLILSFDGATAATYESIRRGADFHRTLSNIEKFLEIKGPPGKSPFTVVQLIYMEKNQKERQEFLDFWERKNIDAARIKPFINYPGLDTHLGAIKRLSSDEPCFLLWRQLAIYWDGMAAACCFDYTGQSIIGDFKRQPLQDVWNSKAMQDLRANHLKRQSQTIAICKNCERPHLNLLTLAAAFLFHDLSIKKLLPLLEKKALAGKTKHLSYFSLSE